MATQFLPLAGGTLAYDDTGSGPLIVAVPGLGDLRAEYRLLTPRLVQAGYRVVSFDLRGQGESSTGWANFKCESLGADLLALVKHLQAGPALVIGTSMGAAAAVCAGADEPELVRGLVLIGPFVRGGSRWKSALIATLIATPPWGVAFWCRYFTTLFPTARPGDFPEYLAKLKRNLKEPGRLRALRRLLADDKAGSDVRLARVQAPVHILMGTRDPDFKQPAQEVKKITQRLSAAPVTAEMIEGAGHYPHVEMPGPAAESILAFFAALDGSPVRLPAAV